MKIMKRILSAIMLLAMLASLAACAGDGGKDKVTTAACTEHTYVSSVKIPAKTFSAGTMLYTCSNCGHTYEEEIAATNSLKVLAVGNSYTQDSMYYLPDICTNAGIGTIYLGNLIYSGCTLDQHWSFVSSNQGAYTYGTSTGGKWTNTDNTAPGTAFEDEDWDYIIIQNAPGESGMPSTFGNLGNLVDYISEKCPNAQIIWHQTWAYETGSSRRDFPVFNNDQMTMYQAIMDTVNNTVLVNEKIDGVIPTGTAIQNLRSSYIGDVVTRDGYHMNSAHGRYTAALTWYAYLSGRSVDNITYAPSGREYVANDFAAVKESVKNALAMPYEVTQSQHTVSPQKSDAELFTGLGLDINNFEELDMTIVFGNRKSTAATTVQSNTKCMCTSGWFTKEDIPVGSVIIIDNGYLFLPDGWLVEGQINTGARPGKVTAITTVVTEDWWDGYAVRAFNVQPQHERVMTEGEASALRIYVPKA